MSNASPPPPPITSPSKKRLLANPKQPREDPSQDLAPNHKPYKDKITRDLPNLSECHGCGFRIDYGNPKARLQPLDSFWRIVLLCKKCIKRVNSGLACLYCFKATVNSVPDCISCPDCERLIHKECVRKYGNSSPWSYSYKGIGSGLELGFSVCIDCWVPELLKSSVRVCRKNKNENDVGGKGDGGAKSMEDMVKDANCAVKDKIAVAAKAKEKALRKAVAAHNAVEFASNAFHLAVKKDVNGDTSEGLVRNSNDKGNGASDVSRVADDTELAFRLHRAMNSSPRISGNTCSVNLSCLDLYKVGSNSISAKWMDLGSHEDGMVTVGSNAKLNEDHDRSISEDSANVGHKGSRSAVDLGRLKPVMKTYRRTNLKRKDYLENVEAGNVVTDDSKIVLEKSFLQDVNVKTAQALCPQHSDGNVNQLEARVKAKPDRYFVKYSKKMTGSRRVLHKEASSCPVASKKEHKDFVLGLPACCSTECSRSSDTSLRSCVVNQQ